MSTRKKVAIIGHGYVGQGMERFFKDHYDLIIVDPKYQKDDEHDFTADDLDFETNKQRARDEAAEISLAVICVPTPMSADASVDLSFVNEVFTWLPQMLVLIKSTIPPGTCREIKKSWPYQHIVFSPEYMGEGKYQVQWWKDKGYPHPTEMKLHDFQIFGGEKADTTAVVSLFQKVMGPDPKMAQTNWETAELCKYMENSWGAAKVIFCNEFYEIAKAFGVDYNELRELWLMDGRVERMHTAVFPDGRGFGGKCFPKDINGIVQQSIRAGYYPKLLAAVLQVNEDLQNEQENS